jgi:hypothetical protein
VDKCVSIAVVRLDEAEALGGIEPLNCSIVHSDFLSNRYRRSPSVRMTNAVKYEFEGEDRESAGARKQSSTASSMDAYYRVIAANARL